MEAVAEDDYVGFPDRLQKDQLTVLHPAGNLWGFASKRPLFSGEGFHILMALPEDGFWVPSWDEKLFKIFDYNGDIIIAWHTLAVILGSFILSVKYIAANRHQIKANLKKNAVMLRYLAYNRFDMKALGGFLLELYRKNIIDIQQAEETILLIKRTDNLQSLSPYERRAVKELFLNNESVFNANKNNFLKIRRAAQWLSKELNRNLQIFILKLNSGYLFFSIGMLLLGEWFMASLQMNPSQKFAYLVIATAVMGAAMMLFKVSLPFKGGKWLLRGLSLLLIIPSFVAMSAIISPWAAIAVVGALVTIMHFTAIYAQRNGLLKAQIDEAIKMKDYLRQHHDNIMLGRDILNYQGNILALDMADEFVPQHNNEFYKLDVMKSLLEKFN